MDKDEDLRWIVVDFRPRKLGGTITLTGDGEAVRLWKANTKGTDNLIGDDGHEIVVSPENGGEGDNGEPRGLGKIYAEGIDIDTARLTAEYKSVHEDLTFSKGAHLRVMSLVESLGETWPVIHEYNSSIDFELKGAYGITDPDAIDFVYEWNNGVDDEWVVGSRKNPISYGDANQDVELPGDEDRQNLAVKVRLRKQTVSNEDQGGEDDDCIIELKRDIKVALEELTGDLLEQDGGDQLDKHLEIRDMADPPQWLKCDPEDDTYCTETPNFDPDVWGSQEYYEEHFDLLEPQWNEGIQTINEGERLQYSPRYRTHGFVITNAGRPGGMGDGRRVHLAFIGRGVYEDVLFDKRSVRAVISHEFRHLQQHREVAEDTDGSLWRMLDDHFKALNRDGNSYLNISEADATSLEFLDEELGWYYFIGPKAEHPMADEMENRLQRLERRYNEAKGELDEVGRDECPECAHNNHVERTRAFLQKVYLRMGKYFPEMQRSPVHDYENTIRPPE